MMLPAEGMIRHIALGPTDAARSRQLQSLYRRGIICMGGNRKLKIYGTLHCFSGRKMHMGNRVFFSSEAAALAAGYRPCGHCMKPAYREWKKKQDAST